MQKLTEKHNRELVAGIQEQMKKLVEGNRYLVEALARVYSGENSVLYETLVSVGERGLMRAAILFRLNRIYEPKGRPFKFTTYATWFIRQSIRQRLPLRLKLRELPGRIREDVDYRLYKLDKKGQPKSVLRKIERSFLRRFSKIEK